MENIQTTELRKLADSLHLGEYPQGLEQAYEEVKNKNYPACDLALIDSLQEQYSVFGKYYEDVRKSAEEINADPVRSEWVLTAVKFVLSAPHDEAYKMPAPPQDLSRARTRQRSCLIQTLTSPEPSWLRSLTASQALSTAEQAASIPTSRRELGISDGLLQRQNKTAPERHLRDFYNYI